MIKVNTGIYKMPYFNVEHQDLRSVNKIKKDHQEVACVCGGTSTGCTNEYHGYKYNFKYQANPTIEPITYKLKGLKLNASLSFNNIGLDVEEEIMDEVEIKIATLGNGIELDILTQKLNEFNNLQLSNKIFLKQKRMVYKGEVYDEENYLDTLIPSFTMTSDIFLININLPVVELEDITLPLI